MLAVGKTSWASACYRCALRNRCSRGDHINIRILRFETNAAYKTHYEVLKVDKHASQAEIKSQFIKLSKEYHPDVSADKGGSHDKFVRLNEAYSVLSKSTTRSVYDSTLHYGNLYQTSSTRPHPRRHPGARGPYGQPFVHVRPPGAKYGKGYEEYHGYAEPFDYYRRSQNAENDRPIFILGIVWFLLAMGISFHYAAFRLTSRMSPVEPDMRDRKYYEALYEARARSIHHGNASARLQEMRRQWGGYKEQSDLTKEAEVKKEESSATKAEG